MPVTDLRYILGVPTEAPANPGFQRTRQLAGQPVSPYQSAIDFENAASSVQANRGLAYLQGIQNHQNEIAQQAQNLRIQQEAQLAAEQATQGLAGIQPDQPEYLSQRQQILQQNPNALLNPQFRNALNVYDEGYQRVAHQRDLEARQLQAQRQQAHSLGLRAIEYGAPPDVVAEHVQSGNVGALAQLTGEARRASTGRSNASTKSPELAALKDNFDLLADERNQFIKDGAEVPADIEKEYQETKRMLVGARKSLYMKPEANAPAAAPAPTAKAESAPIAAPVIEEAELANVPYAEIGKVAAQKKAESEEIGRVNQAWSQAKNELEEKLKTVVPDAPFAGTKINQLERFAKAVIDDEVMADANIAADISGATAAGEPVPVWYPVLSKLNLKGEAFRNPDSALLSKTSVPYRDLIKAWAQDYLNRKGKLLPTKESPNGSALTEQQIKDMNDLATLAKSK